MKKLSLVLCILMLISMVACRKVENDIDRVGDNVRNGIDNVGDNIQGDIRDIVGNNENDDIVNEDIGNVFTGSAQGYGGEVRVRVTMNGDDIESVIASGENETQDVGSLALEEIPKRIEGANSTEVEVVSGATITSNAVKEAVREALTKRN